MHDANEPGQAGAPVDPVATLEARLGLCLGDRSTALAALTHKSYVNEHRDEPGLGDNERLEFLGDAVIDLAVSHRLMERFPAAREGDLSKMRAAVVDEQGLSEMARALDLGSLLRLGRGEELTGGRRKASLLADAMEAVVAALYLDAGLAPVLVLIDRFLGDAFARAAAGTLDRDFKTQLQELAQSRVRATPRYRVVGEHGPDHSKTFEVETELRGEVVGRGTGRSKKDAEQAAAKIGLDLLLRRCADESAAAGAGGGTPAAPAESAVERTAPEHAAPASPPPDTDEPRVAGQPAPGAAVAAAPVPAVEPAAELAPPAEGTLPTEAPAAAEPPSEPPPAKRVRAKAARPAKKSTPKARRSAPEVPATKKARKGARRRK
ncbi:ribonuclease III [Anaeromyxobacter sp. Fw109-5]|uniref:ribonuclease III n=1 Tax=Anaeromyxobacter sp. (strain Fw109-5) TaxID=404589 RepID=UPI0000ED7534|nr:ribonuclease III [Anaeromyxobacter sp. Fw109-5]ABS26361.1 Ribonuclease III [Anaeromyxobacter sp. Fw109-5]